MALVEFADVSDAQRGQINAFAADAVWSGYGQQIMDAIPAAERTTLEQDDSRALNAFSPDLTRRVAQWRVVTGLWPA